jgi:hypothetical protein
MSVGNPLPDLRAGDCRISVPTSPWSSRVVRLAASDRGRDETAGSAREPGRAFDLAAAPV